MRPAKPDEVAFVADALERFGPSLVTRWLQEADAEFWLGGEKTPKLYLVRRVLGARLREAGEAATSAGLWIGELHPGELRLALEGADEVGRRATSGRVIVGEKTAQLFLYGRDILGEGVYRFDRDLGPGDTAIVLTRRGDVLGLGRLVRALPARGRALEPVVDRGWYLREGG